MKLVCAGTLMEFYAWCCEQQPPIDHVRDNVKYAAGTHMIYRLELKEGRDEVIEYGTFNYRDDAKAIRECIATRWR